jgi:hypothetical protein
MYVKQNAFYTVLGFIGNTKLSGIGGIVFRVPIYMRKEITLQ